jgi:hypothetical protein
MTDRELEDIEKRNQERRSRKAQTTPGRRVGAQGESQPNRPTEVRGDAEACGREMGRIVAYKGRDGDSAGLIPIHPLILRREDTIVRLEHLPIISESTRIDLTRVQPGIPVRVIHFRLTRDGRRT